MNILLATEVIHPGGAETFVLRLSKALKNKGHEVVIFAFYKDYFSRSLYDSLAADVKLVFADIPFPRLLGKIDSLLFRMNLDLSVRNFYIRKSLKKQLEDQKTDIIHSHLFKTDHLCTTEGAKNGVPVVTTVHGDYIQFYHKSKSGEQLPLLNYAVKAPENLQKLEKIVCITDKQQAFFREHFKELVSGKLAKIYNGYPCNRIASTEDRRQCLGIGEKDFVFGMVSRGIPEKGWEPAIKAFRELNMENAHLVLVGDSIYLDQLKTVYARARNVHFTGHSDHPLEWINIFDAGLLPSTYPSESLPTVIIEYLCCEVPVIASDAGDIGNMLEYEGSKAGIIIPIRNGRVNEKELLSAMQTYLSDTGVYEAHRTNAATCFSQFDMDVCIQKYVHVYQDAIILNTGKRRKQNIQ